MSAGEQHLMDLWAHHRDAEAFKALTDRYAGLVYSTCRRILGNAVDAEDVAQECFEALARAGHRPGRYLAPWLHRVATNKSLKHVRSDKRRRLRENTFRHEDVNIVSTLEKKDLCRLVDEAVTELPEDLRVPVVAHFLENKTHDSIAMDLGVSRQTVTYRIGKGVEQLRRRLGADASALSVVSLAELFKPVDSVPLSLSANLGKLALAGPAAVSGGMTLIGTVKAAIAALTLICAGGLASFYFFANNSQPADPDDVLAMTQLAQKQEAPGQASPAAPAPSDATGPSHEQTPSVAPETEDAGQKTVQALPTPGFRPYSHLEETYEKGKQVFCARQFILNGTVRRGEFPDGRIVIFNVAEPSTLVLVPEQKLAVKKIFVDFPPSSHASVEKILERIGPNPKPLGERTVEGRLCNGLFSSYREGVDTTAWIDKKTGLPVRIEYYRHDDGYTTVLSEFSFNIDTNPALFNMAPPDGYDYKEEKVYLSWLHRLFHGLGISFS